MVLKYASTPQVNFGGNQGSVSDVWRRFPEGARPIATAPETATPLIVYEPNGTGHWAMQYSGAWRKLAPFKDWRTGAVSWRMDGTMISNPVAWLPRKK